MQTIEIKNGVQLGVEELLKGIRQLDNQALATLNHLLEEKSAERIMLLGELAKLRGVPVQQVAAEFKTVSGNAPA